MSFIRFEVVFDGEIDGFSLADLTLYANQTIFTTSESPKFKLMIFISLSDLMTGISDMIKNTKRKHYSLLSISSSFQLDFEKVKNNILISHKEESETVPFLDFIEALYLEMNRLLKLTERLDEDSGIEDFVFSYRNFEQAITHVRTEFHT